MIIPIYVDIVLGFLIELLVKILFLNQYGYLHQFSGKTCNSQRYFYKYLLCCFYTKNLSYTTGNLTGSGMVPSIQSTNVNLQDIFNSIFYLLRTF